MTVITVTYRYNDMDKLAFDILHELYHIEHHLSEESNAFISIEGTEYSNDPREKEANDFARQMLIPDEIWASILKVGCTSLSPHQIVKSIATEAAPNSYVLKFHYKLPIINTKNRKVFCSTKCFHYFCGDVFNLGDGDRKTIRSVFEQ